MKQPSTVNLSATSVFKALLVVIGVLLAYYLRDLILVVLASVVLASSIEPITRWLINHKIPRLPAVLSIYAFVGALCVIAFYFLFIPLLNDAAIFVQDLPTYTNKIELWSPLAAGVGLSSQPVVQGLSSSISLKELASEINNTLTSFSGGILATFSTIFGGVLSFILIIVISFYLAVQERGIEHFLRMVIPAPQSEYAVSLWNRTEKKIGLWMQGQVLLVVIVAVLVYLGLTLLGVRNALLLAVIAGALEIIPVFGPIISAIPGTLIAFVDHGMTTAVLVIGMYIIIQQFENHLIYPLVVKKVVGLSPILVVIALIAGAKLAGFLGVLLSVPVAAAAVEMIADLHMRHSAR